MWIDTHAHLDAPEFGAQRQAMLQRARDAGVGCIVIPAVEPGNFDAVRELAHAQGFAYALGVHPLYVGRLRRDELRRLRDALAACIDDPRLVAVGEIGLDHFVDEQVAPRAEQQWWWEAQLDLAAEFALPVLLHVRRTQDLLAAGLRRRGWGGRGLGGIAHAFNGSEQQARAFIEQGLCLGFGGTLSYERSRNIRRLAQGLDAAALVLETDAPDMAPQWIAHGAQPRPNEPAELPRIGAVLAGLRGWTPRQVAMVTAANARRALPRLAALLDAPGESAVVRA